MQEIPIELIDFAQFMADEARKVSRLYYRSQLGVETKADNSPVTEADRKIEENIRKLVQNNFPQHGVYGEEFGQERAEAEYQWVIDPIDGTKSFISGRPLFGTLISLVLNGRPVLGIIDQPIIDERWLGVNGETKFNGKPVNTRTGVGINSAVFAVTSPLLSSKRGKELAVKFADAAGITVYGGDCYSYGQLAMGLVDVVVESDLKPYDFCALVPIIENAGGVITDWLGNSLNIYSKGDVLACGDAALHKHLLENFL
jgi:inositol-phosphate phosphatase / L-galactose 1-phosphate phosphatase / histidinol-phosphatase